MLESRLVRPLVNAWVWTVCVLACLFGWIVVGLVFVVTAPFDRGRYWAGRTFRLIGVFVVKSNPLWHFTTSGTPPKDPRRPYVAVSNHESYADIFLLCFLPWEMKWLSKDTIFKIPCMGWMMRMAGDIPLSRDSAKSRGAALTLCKDRLARKVSVMIFPEGTRSIGGELQPFFDGAFRVAIEMQCPVLPIAIAGTTHAMAKGTFQFMPARAEARVLPPVETTGLTLDDVAKLRNRVRGMIDEARLALRRENGLEALYAEVALEGEAYRAARRARKARAAARDASEAPDESTTGASGRDGAP